MTGEQFAQEIIAMQATLYRVAYGLLPREVDREDAVQETIRKAFWKKDTLRDDALLKTWVIRILIRESQHMAKRQRREVLAEEMDLHRTAPPEADIDLHDAFLALDERTRLPAVLYYMEGYETKEIAEILRVPQGTVKSRLHRAREALRRKLTEGDGQHG